MHQRIDLSPERVDPCRSSPTFESILKIVSGLDTASRKAIIQIYSPVFETPVPVSQPEVAEMTKLYENCQRMMCITLANEMTYELGIDHRGDQALWLSCGNRLEVTVFCGI